MNIKKIPPTVIVPIDPKLPDIPKPYQRDIYLFETYIAGTSYIPNIEEIVQALNEEEVFSFFRETENEYDIHAIVIKTKNHEKTGYLPASDNQIFSRLMDAGKLLFGKLNRVEVKGKWYKVYIDIYLKD